MDSPSLLLGDRFHKDSAFGEWSFPNVIAPIIILAVLDIGTAILASGGLSFLGLWAQPRLPDWGSMINQGQAFLSVLGRGEFSRGAGDAHRARPKSGRQYTVIG